jgi:hypothetical protein
MGAGALSLECEADNSGQEWRTYTSTPQYVLMAWCLIKHRDNFIIHHMHNNALGIRECNCLALMGQVVGGEIREKY